MTIRENTLGWMRIAGYHGDKRAFTRLLIENGVSRKAADEAWQQGQRQKQAGMRCTCYDCTKATTPLRRGPSSINPANSQKENIMGHDISCYKKADTNKSEEISYLRRGAGNPLARVIYKAMGAEDCDCGCSGCGCEKTFTTEELVNALSKLPPGEDTEAERTFLNDCIAASEPVTVTFY